MITIYIDADYLCHTSNPGGIYTAVETDVFDGKCDAYIEGYRYIPAGQSWTRSDGVTFEGEMLTPWKSWQDLDAVQRDYERDLAQSLSDENAALVVDMAQMVDEVYQSDMEMMGL